MASTNPRRWSNVRRPSGKFWWSYFSCADSHDKSKLQCEQWQCPLQWFVQRTRVQARRRATARLSPRRLGFVQHVPLSSGRHQADLLFAGRRRAPRRAGKGKVQMLSSSPTLTPLALLSFEFQTKSAIRNANVRLLQLVQNCRCTQPATTRTKQQ